jgi:protein-S-isoprenylcysteine O-methyltransferase Ste14
VNARGVLALVLQLAFLATAFVGRTITHRRRTGDSGFRWQRHDRSARVSGALFAAAVVIGTLGTALAAFSGTDLWDALDGAFALAAGVVLFIIGYVLTLAAQSAMGTSWRIGVDPAESRTGTVGRPGCGLRV